MNKIVCISVFALSVVGCAAAQQQTPLGDVVRQNKPVKKASRIITDEDMPSHPQPAAAPVASSSGDAAATMTDAKPADDAKDAKPSAKDTKEDASTNKPKESAEVTAMKSRLQQLDMDIPNLQHMVKGTEEAAMNAADDDRRQIFENALRNHRYSLQHAMQEKEDLSKKLEEAKKADDSKKSE